ncbi:eukaryotic translation initiation factor 6 [Vairimorpha apis BRL 01]|uniref:Eukaryotic translation initiation factor 6 n=1 Tax=Vairimorpha apis BRL 01 TaxID=1037528 RepID=T0KXY8_9MICR|nr:eukaryotic translation initiation factor 6 [Vairimorpha apis BRL 01]
MSHLLNIEGSSELGAFITLSNTYCIVGELRSKNTLKYLLENLNMPIVETKINGIRTIGSLCRGNKHGLVLPNTTSDQELYHIRNSLPDTVVVKRIDERLNAFGNIILCNDNICLVHADIERETEECLQDILRVPVYRQNIGVEPLVGKYASMNNQGMLVHPNVSEECIKELSELCEVNVIAGTINSGVLKIGEGIVTNDWTCFAGRKTTNIELMVAESVFELKDDVEIENKKKFLIDEIVQ